MEWINSFSSLRKNFVYVNNLTKVLLKVLRTVVQEQKLTKLVLVKVLLQKNLIKKLQKVSSPFLLVSDCMNLRHIKIAAIVISCNDVTNHQTTNENAVLATRVTWLIGYLEPLGLLRIHVAPHGELVKVSSQRLPFHFDCFEKIKILKLM